MNKEYRVVVSPSYQFTYTEQEITQFLLQSEGNPEGRIHIHNDTVSYHIKDAEEIGLPASVWMGGSVYDVTVEHPLKPLIASMGFDVSQAKKAGVTEAPMPGVIIELYVREGDTVQKGDPLLVLEAMKMENVLLAASEGVVGAIVVKARDTVQKGQLLLEIE